MLNIIWQFVGYISIVAIVILSLAVYLRQEEIRNERENKAK